MDNGNEFQSLGADDLNALSPSVTLNLTDAGVNKLEAERTSNCNLSAPMLFLFRPRP